MKNFSIKALLFLLLQCSIGYALMHRYQPTHPNHYIAATSAKEHRLATAPSPKIVLIGGSNLAFGPDSSEISRVFGMPVVNMGLHGALLLDFHMNQTDGGLRKGDIIVISPEIHSSFTEKESNWFQMQFMIEQDRSMIFHFSKDVLMDLSDMGLQYPNHVLRNRTFKPTPQWPYTADSFNEVGDISALSDIFTAQEYQITNYRFVRYHASRAIQSVNAMTKRWEDRGVTVLFTWPSIWQEMYDRSPDQYDKLEEFAKTHLDTTPILGIKESLLPAEQFWNTPYHLNSRGRESRTKLLIDAMRKHLVPVTKE